MANYNPSPKTRFGAENGNKPNGGKTSAQKKAEYAAAEKAAILRDKMLSSIMDKVEAGQDVMEFIDQAILKLFKDSEDRAHGSPNQAVDHTSSDGTMSPKDVKLSPDDIVKHASELVKKLTD